MKWITEKISELLSNIWIKLAASVPASLFLIEEKEKFMIVALLTVITVDCIFGAMVAFYVKRNFSWSLLGKKFSKKFLLYFFTLAASFIVSNAYEFIEWWFYVIGTIITFSEFGSFLHKAKKLGLPIDSEIISAVNQKIDQVIRTLLGIRMEK